MFPPELEIIRHITIAKNWYRALTTIVLPAHITDQQFIQTLRKNG